MTDFNYTLWIFLIPFLVFILLGLAGHRLKARISGLLGTAALGVVTVLSYITAYFYYFRTAGINDVFRKITVFDSTWLHFTDTLEIKMGILLDPISVMMLIVISTVSLMVHIYSLGYMKGEKGFERYYSFLSLFAFSMMGLVVATNIFQMYIFWELVGISSYLLIGFYYQKPEAVRASKKAFIVTRFADLGFLIGILLLSFNTRTFDFSVLTDPQGTAIAHSSGISFLNLSITT
jgi:NADH-quinone oxidoreductase subunit L